MNEDKWADPTKATTYTLIAYQPSSERHEGCHCHGTTRHYGSSFEMARGLTFEQLAQKMATLRASIREPGNEEDTGAEYEFRYFDDLGPLDWDEWDRNHFDDMLEALIQKQEPMIKRAREEEAKAAKKEADRAEAERRRKDEEQQREKRDREEFQRLTKKYAKETT